MIRINLLGVREAGPGDVFEAEAPVGGAPSEKKGLLFAVLFLGAAIALIAFQWLSARNTINSLNEEIQQLTQEKQRLQAIIQRVNEYQAKLAELEKREALIEKLKAEREGPVRMLDDLSSKLPDFVWLEQLQQGPNNVTIRGMAASYVSIADYIQKLEESDYFQNVELIDARQGKDEFTSFQLRAQLMSPGAPAAEAAAAGGSGGSL
jgi:type IV pilus assembly protein PilN